MENLRKILGIEYWLLFPILWMSYLLQISYFSQINANNLYTNIPLWLYMRNLTLSRADAKSSRSVGAQKTLPSIRNAIENSIIFQYNNPQLYLAQFPGLPGNWPFFSLYCDFIVGHRYFISNYTIKNYIDNPWVGYLETWFIQTVIKK